MSDEPTKFPIRDKRFGSEAGSESGSESEADSEPAQEPQEASRSESERLAEERLDQLMRLKADFENFRQRMIREKTELVDMASLRIVEGLLPVVDNLERALEAARQHNAGEAIVKGFELVAKQLHEVLKAEGLEQVQAEGEFDPNHHEAVSSVVGEVASPTVLEVVRPGFVMKDKVVRPALVHVSVPPPDGEGGD